MQIYSIFLSDLAKTDLQNIVSYITAADSITRAKYVEHGILSAMKRLERFPTAYPKDRYATKADSEIRFLMKWRYKILFFIDKNTVQVVRIFHTAQNPEKLSNITA